MIEWKDDRFSVYDEEEISVLELIEQLHKEHIELEKTNPSVEIMEARNGEISLDNRLDKMQNGIDVALSKEINSNYVTSDNNNIIETDDVYNLDFKLRRVIKSCNNNLEIMNEDFNKTETYGKFTFDDFLTDIQWANNTVEWDINEFGLNVKPPMGTAEHGYKSQIKLKTSNCKISTEWIDVVKGVNVRCGIMKDANNFIFMSIDRMYNELAFELLIKVNGNLTATLHTPQRDLTKWFAEPYVSTPKKLNMYIFNNVITFTAEFRDREILICEQKLTNVDFTDIETLNSWSPSWGIRLEKQLPVTITNFNVSYTGGLNLGADYKIITYEDNKPIIRNNKIYFTSTTHSTTDISGNGTNVYEMDVNSYDVKLVGKIAFKIEDKVKNLGSSKVIYDREVKKWYVVGTDFTANPVLTYCASSEINLLSGINVVDGWYMNLPNGNLGTWDIDIIKLNNRYEVIYTLEGSPRIIVKAWSNNLIDFTEIKRVNTSSKGEGSVICVVGGKRYFTHVSEKTKLDLFNYDTMEYIKDVPMSWHPGSNLTPTTPMPWGSITVIPTGSVSRYILMMFDMEKIFDMSYGYGNLCIYETDYIGAKTYKSSEQLFL